MKGRILIENVQPSVDAGRWPAKAVVGEPVTVSTDVFRDGHEPIRVVLRWRAPGERSWNESPMEEAGNDVWTATFVPTMLGRLPFTIAAWADPFDYWRVRAGTFVLEGVGQLMPSHSGAAEALIGRRLPTAALQPTPIEEIEVELAEAAAFIKERAGRARGDDRAELERVVDQLLSDPPLEDRLRLALSESLVQLMTRHHDKAWEDVLRPHLELVVDARLARTGAWYEMFPRSEGGFRSAEKRLPAIAAMGFEVLYLPPIHPIGRAHRKGRDNALAAGPDDPGSPWAIGSENGGHTAVHPDLGTIDDFDHFVAAARQLGIEVALDFAIQCSPDHPWATEHPEFFSHRIDGAIRYAENPPKKYQDIYPINWDGPHAPELFEAWREVLMHWVGHGVHVFRVDNPHTKPLPFWEWVIREIQRERPDVVFLSEAFTRPKVMKALAKAGFSQSYTYFTWRNTKAELTEYLTELAGDGSAAFLRTNFFTNTQDILHAYLQHGGPGAFATRLLLAATMSPSYGIYSGYELYENIPQKPGSEEYFASEKYEVRPRQWDQPGSLVPLITRINDVRRQTAVFDRIDNITFCDITNDEMIAYLKQDVRGDAVLCVVNLDPVNVREATVQVRWWEIPGVEPQHYVVEDMLTGERYHWAGEYNYVKLDPERQPGHLLRFVR